MNPKTTDFLFGCKNLYFLDIHPFDFNKSGSKEYKGIIELGRKIIKEIGLQSFAGFMIEHQYRVGIWSSMIVLEYGRPDLKEIVEFGSNTIFNTCIKEVEKEEIQELSTEIMRNKKEWIEKIKTSYSLI